MVEIEKEKLNSMGNTLNHAFIHEKKEVEEKK